MIQPQNQPKNISLMPTHGQIPFEASGLGLVTCQREKIGEEIVYDVQTSAHWFGYQKMVHRGFGL